MVIRQDDDCGTRRSAVDRDKSHPEDDRSTGSPRGWHADPGGERIPTAGASPTPAGDPPPRPGEATWLRRRQLERQLHDSASLRISALSLRLGLLLHRSPPDEVNLQACIREVQDELHLVLQELRAVAGQIYPSVLDGAGLGAALRELADQREVELTVSASGGRFGPTAEGAAYFAVAECVAAEPNTAHDVAIWREGTTTLVVRLTEVEPRHAANLLDHLRPLGGALRVTRHDDRETCTMTMKLPCE